MAKKSYSNWAKSFGRSVKFGAKEILSEVAPNLAETAGSLQEDVRELKQDIRKLRSNKRQIVNYMLGEDEQFSKYLNIGLKNAKSSFKSGKLIDPKRSEKLMMEAMGMGDMDFGNFDDNDSFDDMDFGSVEMGPSTVINMSGPSTEAMNSVSETVATGFQNLDRSNKNAFAISEALEKRFHAEKMTQLQNINSNLVSIVTFNNETWSTYVKASMEFYDRNLELMTSMNDALLRLSPVPKKRSERIKQENPVDAFMSGGFSLKGYSQFVARNARRSFQNSLVGSMLPLVNNEMMLSDFAANPLGMFLKAGIENYILPDRFKKSLGRMDRSFHNFLPAALTKLGNYNGTDTITQLISEIFGISTKVSAKRFTQGEYEHGAIPYDGESKAALTRVIPGYLSRMTAIMEVIARRMKGGVSEDKLEEMIRQNAIVYNDSKVGTGSGSFMRLNEARSQQRREERNTITRGYTDSSYELRSALGKYEDIKGINIDDLLENYLVGATHLQDELKLDDVDQIKRFIQAGIGNGKLTNDKSYLKDPDMQRMADAMLFALNSLKKEKNDVLLGLYGRERHEARTNLSNYNKYYGSDDEYGAGRNTYLSKLNIGSATDLYSKKESDRYIVPQYMIERLDDGHYYMPQRALEEYNRLYGGPSKNKFKNADDAYRDWKKRNSNSVNRVSEPKETTSSTEAVIEQTLTQKIRETIQLPFNKMADAFDFVDRKMHEFIFGKDGLGGNLKDLFLGKKGENGEYTDGWFSEAINGIKAIYQSTKSYLFGGEDKDGNKVEGILSNSVNKFKNLMDEYFFGEEKEEIGPDGKKKKRASIFEKIQATLVEGFGGLASTLFGNVDDESGRTKSLEQAKAAFKKAIPDMGKGAGLGAILGTISGFGGFGLLGSLFLPGGPIGGALVGGAISLLSQAKGFREMLFGREEEDEKGNIKRVGGLISNDIIDWFKKKKTAILGGSVMGVLSTATGHGIAFGLMPSIAVGAFGPVIAGAAWGLISHSERFRTLIFGREGEDGKRIGGLINANMVGSIKKSLPRGIAGAISGVLGMGVISQLGLVGSMVATGPIPAAILGASFGIASASKEFTNRMFGYVDEGGKYHSGALDKVKNFFTWEIFEPVKLRIMEEWHKAQVYMRKHIFRPIRRAFFPIKAVFVSFGKSIKEQLENSFKPIKQGIENIFFVLTDNLKKVFTPIVKAVSTIGDWMFKRFKTAMHMSIQTALLPIRMVGGLARMYMYGKDYKSSVTEAVKGIGSAITGKGDVFGAIGTLGKAVFNPESASLGEANAEDERLRKEDEQFELEGNSYLQAERKKMEAMREKMRAGGFGLTEEQIAEKFKKAKKRSEAEANVVEAGAKSQNLLEQLQSAQIQKISEGNIQRGSIVEGINAMNSKLSALVANEGISAAAIGAESDDNASVVDEQNKLEKEKEAEQEQKDKLVAAVDQIVENTDPDKQPKPEKEGFFSKLLGGIGSVISGIFGLGQIGSLLLGGIGAIAALIKFGGGDNDDKRKITTSEAMGNIANVGMRKGLKVSGKFGRKAMDWWGKEITNERVIKSFQGDKVVGMRKEIVGTGKTHGQQIMENIDAVKNKVSGFFKNAVTKDAAQKGPVDKLISAGNSAIDYISKTKWIKNPKFPKVANILEVFKAVVSSIGKLLTTQSFRDKVIHYVAKKGGSSMLIKGAAKSALGILTGGTAAVAFGVYDGISGAARAGFYFDVADEDVDWKMRLISSAINVFFGLPLMFAYDFGLSLTSIGVQSLGGTALGELMNKFGMHPENFDHRKLLAQLMYRMMGDDADSAKLDNAQKKLLDEYKAHLDANGLTEHNMSLEEFQDKVKGQGGLWKSFGAPILNRVFGIDDPFKGKSFMDRVHDTYEGLVKWFKEAIDKIISFNPLDFIKEQLTNIFNPIKERWDKMTSTPWITDETKEKGASLWERFKNSIKHDKNDKSWGSGKLFSGKGNGFNYMGDARWKNHFGDDGCAQMTLANMFGISPEVAASLGLPGDNTGFGTKASYFMHAAGKLGLGYRENRSPQDLYAALMSGLPTAVGGSSSNPNSPFYGNGHYIMASGINPDGTVNIVNPTSRDKSGVVDFNKLLSDSIANGGFSGSFIGAGRMSLAAAKGTPPTDAEAAKIDKNREDMIKRLKGKSDSEMVNILSTSLSNRAAGKNITVDEETAAAIDDRFGIVSSNDGKWDTYNKAMVATLAKGKESNNTGFVDEETAVRMDKEQGITAVTDGTKEIRGKDTAQGKAEVKKDGSLGDILPKNLGGDTSNKKIGLLEVLTGFGLGLKNLFSSAIGGGKYEWVKPSDLFGGLKSLFGIGAGLISGPIQAKLLQAARSFLGKGIRYSQSNPGRLDPDSSGYTDCSGYTAAIYKKAFGKDMLTPYGGEFDNPDMAGQWNESSPIDVSDAQIGDLVFWETSKGVPDNHVGMVTDPKKHMAVASNTSTGPAEFQWDNSYWKPMFTGIRRPKVLAALSTSEAGGGGSIDTTEGRIETKKAVWDYLINKMKMNREGASGVMGNIQQESNFNTGAYNPNDVDGTPSGGLVQWHNDRFANLKAHAASIGESWDSVDAQMGYLAKELSGEIPGYNYSGVYRNMANAVSVQDAVDSWVRDFEIPADIPGEIAKRTPMARSYYNDTTNFTGGANGAYAGTINAMLTGWLNNYKQRKAKNMQKQIQKYASTYRTPGVLYSGKPVASASSTNMRVLPAKVDTGGASMDDLLLSIRALDSHSELAQIIHYLAIIAATNSSRSEKPKLTSQQEQELQRTLEKAKREAKDAHPGLRLNSERAKDMVDAVNSLGNLSRSNYEVAIEIAKGGEFRKT